MRNRVFCHGWMICFMAGSMVLGLGADTERGQRSGLEGAEGLSTPVTYTETKIPLGELVQKVAEATGVPLTAARDVADEPVAVVVKDLPARELLEQLADLLGYRWSRRTPAAGSKLEGSRLQVNTDPNNLQPANLQPATVFEIWQDLASKQSEEALRQATWAEVEARFQQDLRHSVEVAALSQEQLDRLLEAEEQPREELTKLTAAQRQALLNSPEEKVRRRRYNIARRLTSPTRRSLAGLLGRLSHQQWALLRQGQSITFSTDPQPGELSLPMEAAGLLRASRPRMLAYGRGVSAVDPGLIDRLRQREGEMQAQWLAAAGFLVTIRLDINRFKSEGLLSLSATASAIRAGAPAPSAAIGGGLDTTLVMIAEPDNPQPGPLPDAPERRSALEQDPVLGTPKRFSLATTPHVKTLGSQRESEWRIGELLPELARTYDIPFIADAYWDNPPIDAGEFSTAEPTALSTLLDRWLGDDYRWDCRERLVRVRSRRWYFQRPREVPLRFLRRWQDLCAEHGALPLDEYAEIAAVLSDGQLESLDGLVEQGTFPEELRDLIHVNRARHALRLYGSLAPPQRQALARGQAIAVAQMSATQRDLFMAAVEVPGPSTASTPNIGAGRFSMSSEPSTRIRKAPAGVTSLPVTSVRFDFASENGKDLRSSVSLVVAAPR